MSTKWPKVKLGEVIRRSAEIIEILADLEYREVTVRLWGNGVVERRRVLGNEIAGSRRFVVRVGQFIVSRIDARNGAMGLVPPELDGAIVSNDFPLFDLDKTKIQPEFLGWLCQTREFVELCQRASEGTTNRVRLQEGRFLALEIPLPPLTEQQRIVEKIDQLAAKITEARSLRHQATKETDALGRAARNLFFISAGKRFALSTLEELSSRITKGESPEWQGYTYQDDGPLFIRSENVLWGALDPRNAVHIPEAFHEKLSRSQLCEGDVLINLVGASIGRPCAVPVGLGSANVNQAVGVIRPRPDRLLSDFLVHFLLCPVAQDEIHAGKVETARPNISLSDLRDLEIPIPPLPEQRRIVAELNSLQAEVEGMERLQAKTISEIDALLASILDKAFKGRL